MTKKLLLVERYLMYCRMFDEDLHTLLDLSKNGTTDPEIVKEMLDETKKIQTLKIDAAMKLARMGFKESKSLDYFALNGKSLDY